MSRGWARPAAGLGPAGSRRTPALPAGTKCCAQHIKISMDGKPRLVCLIRLQTDNFRLFLCQQTDK